MNKSQFYSAFVTLVNHSPFTTKSNISTYKTVLDRALELGLVTISVASDNPKNITYRVTDLGRAVVARVEGHLSL